MRVLTFWCKGFDLGRQAALWQDDSGIGVSRRASTLTQWQNVYGTAQNVVHVLPCDKTINLRQCHYFGTNSFVIDHEETRMTGRERWCLLSHREGVQAQRLCVRTQHKMTKWRVCMHRDCVSER